MKKILFCAILTAIFSCKKETKESSASIITLNSTVENLKVKGFSFARGGLVDWVSSEMPDFIVMAYTNSTGKISDAYLSNPNLEKRFHLTRSFNKVDSAAIFFKSLKLPKDTLFQDVALPVKPYQVWIIKTNQGTFGKLLIHEATAKEINTVRYAEVKFEWGKL